ncbi:MAG: hypothetical protein R3B09_29745 [Nannocystaceae bacterium]
MSQGPTIEALEQELNQMLVEGHSMAAFERFYADDVTIQENSNPAVVGKEQNRRREESFFTAIEAVEVVTLLGWAVRGHLSYSEWVYEIRMVGGRRLKIAEVAARRWRDGQVVHERYYHDSAF